MKRIDLNGTWKLKWSDHQRGDKLERLLAPDADLARALDARVPGEVHLDLMRAGLIKEPAEGLNSLESRWVEETLWRYVRDFRAPALRPGERAFLTFGCLDLAAVVYLNGKEAGRHANAFHPCTLDVTALLRPGSNTLLVDLDCGLHYAAEKPVHAYAGPDNTLNKRHWLRKTQSQFGWDWSLRLGNVGISGDVTLEIVRDVRVESVAVLADVSDDLARGRIRARVFAHGLAEGPVEGVLTVEAPTAGARARVPVTIRPGAQTLEAVLNVEHPELWWPVGHGRPARYAVTVRLAAGGRQRAAVTRRVGFRSVRVRQDPHPAGGRFFVVEINGKPIFLKGGNFVPADVIFARLDRRRYAALVDRALEANFNFLRVWGGGLYESDDFYDLCDERGILVWQEFIFACSRYPSTDEVFLNSVRREATWQVRRLAHHPSLIVWCGNNEMEWGCWSWNYDKGAAFPDYALFHLVLPVLLKREDDTRYYQPSSPYSPDHAFPNQDDVGDQHPWSVGFQDTDFRKYRDMICRFPNEGGTLGSTSLPTVLACLPRGHRRPGSFAWEQHDNSVSYWGGGKRYPDAMLELWLGRKLEDLSLEDYVYWAGVVQGAGLAEYIRNFRRRMFDSAAAVFWMYNDCWPVVRSWTIVDYYLRRTPSFHPVRRAFAPVAAAIAVENGRVAVYGINERAEPWHGSLRFGLFALAGRRPFDQTLPVVLPPNASTRVAEFHLADWKRLGERTHGAFALLRDGRGREAARDTMFLPLFREMRWPRAAVRATRHNGQAIFESRTFAWRVCLDLDGAKGLPDNFFDVLPGIPTVLDWPAALGAPRIVRMGNPG